MFLALNDFVTTRVSAIEYRKIERGNAGYRDSASYYRINVAGIHVGCRKKGANGATNTTNLVRSNLAGVTRPRICGPFFPCFVPGRRANPCFRTTNSSSIRGWQISQGYERYCYPLMPGARTAEPLGEAGTAAQRAYGTSVQTRSCPEVCRRHTSGGERVGHD